MRWQVEGDRHDNGHIPAVLQPDMKVSRLARRDRGRLKGHDIVHAIHFKSLLGVNEVAQYVGIFNAHGRPAFLVMEASIPGGASVVKRSDGLELCVSLAPCERTTSLT